MSRQWKFAALSAPAFVDLRDAGTSGTGGRRFCLHTGRWPNTAGDVDHGQQSRSSSNLVGGKQQRMIGGLLEVGMPELPALQRLEDKERSRGRYLASNMPAADTARTSDREGNGSGSCQRTARDLTLERCQACHIITVVITQDRAKEAWLGTMHKPSHVEIDTQRAGAGGIADYLVINGGMPIEQVPEELRAGGATY